MPALTKEEQAEAEKMAISTPLESLKDPLDAIRLLEGVVARTVDPSNADEVSEQEQARYSHGLRSICSRTTIKLARLSACASFASALPKPMKVWLNLVIFTSPLAQI